MPSNKKHRSLLQRIRHKDSKMKKRIAVSEEIVRNAGTEIPSATENELSHFIDFKDFLNRMSEKADLERGWVIVVDKRRSHDEVCEECGEPATGYDYDGEPLCDDCGALHVNDKEEVCTEASRTQERKGKQRAEITYYLRTDAAEVLHLLNTLPYADLREQEFIGPSYVTSTLSKATVYSSKMEAIAQCVFHETLLANYHTLPPNFFNQYAFCLKVMPVVKTYVAGEFAWAHFGKTPELLPTPKYFVGKK